MLTRDLLDEWLKVLRSDDHEQGIGVLWNPEKDAYCCMGLLCKAGSVDLTQHRPVDGEGVMVGPWALSSGIANNAPPELKDWLPDGIRVALASLNDGSKLSFSRIADEIEVMVADGRIPVSE